MTPCSEKDSPKHHKIRFWWHINPRSFHIHRRDPQKTSFFVRQAGFLSFFDLATLPQKWRFFRDIIGSNCLNSSSYTPSCSVLMMYCQPRAMKSAENIILLTGKLDFNFFRFGCSAAKIVFIEGYYMGDALKNCPKSPLNSILMMYNHPRPFI